MKVLSIQQPWASLIVAGIKDIENRTWKPKETPGRILIHASKKCTMRTVSNEPLEWVQEIFNEQLFGNLPNFPDMPDSSIIGYVTVDAIDKDNAHSIWAAGESCTEDLYYWHLKDAYMFDEPIKGVKGKLHLWDYDIDENNLPPAHKVELKFITVNEDNIIIPVPEDTFLKLTPNSSFTLEVCTLAELLCQPDVYDMKPFKTIIFSYKGHQRTFVLKPETEVQYITDGSEDQNQLKYLSILEPEGAIRWIAYFIWGDEI